MEILEDWFRFLAQGPQIQKDFPIIPINVVENSYTVTSQFYYDVFL